MFGALLEILGCVIREISLMATVLLDARLDFRHWRAGLE
jgi:hypothetical protein